jgi:hypothetical protein
VPFRASAATRAGVVIGHLSVRRADGLQPGLGAVLLGVAVTPVAARHALARGVR